MFPISGTKISLIFEDDLNQQTTTFFQQLRELFPQFSAIFIFNTNNTKWVDLVQITCFQNKYYYF